MTIKMNQGLYTVGDFYGRQITISTNTGLLITDAAGRIVHDTPTAPIAINEYYLGHLLWFQDLAQYKIYDQMNPPLSTWTDATCLLANNNNVKGGLFKCYFYSQGSAVTTIPHAHIALRPKGTNWGPTIFDNSPQLSMALNAVSATFISIYTSGVLPCPIGTDNAIQFYLAGDTSPSARLIITQLGIFI